MKHVDVAVVGLGAMGAMTLWRLAERGADVLGIDRFRPPHDRGSSHGGSRIIRTAYAEGSFYVPLLLEAWPLWEALERAAGARLLTVTGALMIGPARGAIVGGALESARTHDLEHELLDASAAAARWPQHVFAEGDAALYEHRAGVLAPEACVEAALSVAARNGAELWTGRRVLSIESAEASVTLRCDDGGAVSCRHCVVAAGPWTGALLPELVASLKVERQVNAWLAVDDPPAFAPDRFPVFIRELSDGRLRFGMPSLDGRTIKVAVHHEGALTDPDSVQRDTGPVDMAPILEYAATRLRGVRPEPARSIVCLYTNTPDEHFIAGPLPERPNLTVLGGCSGHSFKFSAILGDVAADLALDGSTSRDITAFAPARLTAVGGPHPAR